VIGVASILKGTKVVVNVVMEHCAGGPQGGPLAVCEHV
jgi:hypothetical protein